MVKVSCKECKETCKLCNGTGHVTESKIDPKWDRGDGVMYGGGSWTMRGCPHGCVSNIRVIL